jgi:hypothetical protein
VEENRERVMFMVGNDWLKSLHIRKDQTSLQKGEVFVFET